MANKEFTLGYNRYGLESQPSMNTLQSNYDMFVKMSEAKSNPQKLKTFIGNAMNMEEHPLTIMQMLDILPNLMDLDETTYQPRMKRDRDYIGMQGSYNLNNINRFMNGGKPKMRSKDKALSPQMQSNKYYSNNY